MQPDTDPTLTGATDRKAVFRAALDRVCGTRRAVTADDARAAAEILRERGMAIVASVLEIHASDMDGAESIWLLVDRFIGLLADDSGDRSAAGAD